MKKNKLIPFENVKQPLVPRRVFILRVIKNLAIAALIILISLLIGIVGYHALAHYSWIDSLLNASMILGGMGPVDALPNSASKLFASFYALYSGIAFLSVVAITLAPILHRFLHKIHLDIKEDDMDN